MADGGDGGTILQFPIQDTGEPLGQPYGERPGDPLPYHENPNGTPDPPRMEILEEAARLICVDRHHQHGDAAKNIGLTGDLFSVVAGRRLDAHDVCLMNIMQKISRILCGHRNKDNYSDVAGYIALAWELSNGNLGK